MKDFFKRPVALIATAALLLASVPFMLPVASASGNYCDNFIDVLTTDPICPAVSYVRNRAIFEGYNSGNYFPNLNTNRAEVIKVILAAFVDQQFDTANPPDGAQLGFKDIPAGSHDWWYGMLLRAKQMGFIQGYSDGTFRATSNVTRAEFLKMFLYFSPSKSQVDNTTFTSTNLWGDTPSTAWFAKYMAFANEHGLFANFGPCSYGNICPNAAITRGEVAQLMYNYHTYLNQDVGFPKPGLLTKIYAQAEGNSTFALTGIPSNAIGAFKVPSRVFDLNETVPPLKNVDCSQPTPSSFTEATTAYTIPANAPWVYFYSPTPNWSSTSQTADFYFTSTGSQATSVYGPFTDNLENVVQDIISSRCIAGTFGSANYSGIPAAPNLNPTPVPTPSNNLGVPVLYSPINNSVNSNAQNVNMLFSWSAAANASYYDLMIRLPSASTYFTTVRAYSNSASYYFNIQNINQGYYWKVRAYTSNGSWTDSAENYLSFGSPSPVSSAISLNTPAAGATYNYGSTVDFQWQDTDVPTGGTHAVQMSCANYNYPSTDHWLEWDTTSNNEFFLPTPGSFSSSNTSGFNFSSNIYCKWRVVYYTVAGDPASLSATSNETRDIIFNVTSSPNNPILGTAVLVSPPNDFNGVNPFTSTSSQVNFSWNTAANATSYTLVVGSGTVGTLDFYPGLSTQYSVPLSTLKPIVGKTNYYWYVITNGNAGAITTSADSYFSYVSSSPVGSLGTPSLITPTSNEVFGNYPRTTSFQWTPVSGASQYEMELDCDLCGAGNYSSSQNYYSVNPSLTEVMVGANTFRYRVRALDSNNYPASWSNYSYFSYNI